MQQNIRLGVVSSVDTAAGRVRVAFPDRDNMVSGELPVLRIAGLFALPAVGDPAVCLFFCDGLGSGVFLGSFYPNGAPDTSGGAVVVGDLTVTGLLHGGGIP